MTTAANAQSDEEPGVRLVQLYSDRAAHIQTIGELFTGELEVAASASGFLIADDLVITNNHAVPADDGRYKSMRVDVRFTSRANNARYGKVVARDLVRDLALIEVSPTVAPRPYCPISALGAGTLVPQGSRVYVLSFPLDEDLNVIDGLVSSKKSDLKWSTNAALNVGTSGGAVFSAKGYLVALAVGGITEYTNLDGERSPVFGVNYMIPVGSLIGSEIDTAIQQRAAPDCWKMLTSLPPGTPSLASLLSNHFSTLSSIAGAVGGGGGPSTPTAQPSTPSEPPPPVRLSRGFTVSTIRDEHGLGRTSKRYTERFAAAPGYTIENCSFTASDVENESGVECRVSEDKRSAEFTYRLSSGPFYDRWRGWLHGTVNLRQQREN